MAPVAIDLESAQYFRDFIGKITEACLFLSWQLELEIRMAYMLSASANLASAALVSTISEVCVNGLKGLPHFAHAPRGEGVSQKRAQ